MITVEFRDEIFDKLCEISDQNCDPIVKRRLRAMKGKPHSEIKDELLGLIDDIAYFSLTSDFEIAVLDGMWKEIGGTLEELRTRDIGDTPENREKYKWER